MTRGNGSTSSRSQRETRHRLSVLIEADCRQISARLNQHTLGNPPGYVATYGNQYQRRGYYSGYSDSSSSIEYRNSLQERAIKNASIEFGEIPTSNEIEVTPRKYVAFVAKNPGIDIGLESATEEASTHPDHWLLLMRLISNSPSHGSP